MLGPFLFLMLSPFRGAGTFTPSAPPPEGELWEDGTDAAWETGETLIWESS